MNRWILGIAALLSLLVAGEAAAICQRCVSDNSPGAMCWTLTACETGATMSACIVRPIMGDPDRLWCDSLGTTAGAECNGHDSSCNGGGDDGGGPGGGGGGGGGGCVIQYGQTCPAQCSSCSYEDVW